MTDTEKTTTEYLNPLTQDLIESQKPKKKKGQFKKGHVPMNNSRKGSKNKATIFRDTVLAKAENLVLRDWTNIVQKTIEMANAGDSTALKILWDRMLPSKKAVDVNHKGGPMQVTINVSKLDTVDVTSEEIIEAEYEEVEDESRD